MTDNAQSPPAGWLPDPNGYQRERWWNGSVWTEHTRALAEDPWAKVRDVAPLPSEPHVDAGRSDYVVGDVRFLSRKRDRTRNGFSLIGIWLVLAALLIALFTPILVNWISLPIAIGGLVMGILAVRSSQRSMRGKAKSVWTLVLSIITLPIVALAGIPSLLAVLSLAAAAMELFE